MPIVQPAIPQVFEQGGLKTGFVVFPHEFGGLGIWVGIDAGQQILQSLETRALP